MDVIWVLEILKPFTTKSVYTLLWVYSVLPIRCLREVQSFAVSKHVLEKDVGRSDEVGEHEVGMWGQGT